MTIDSLRQIPLFARWSDDQLKWLLDNSTEVEIAAGDYLYSEMDVADSFFVMLDGEFQITRRFEGEELELYKYHAGDFTGEFALLNKMPFPTAARASVKSRVLKIGEIAFHEMVFSDRFPIGSVMLPVMAKRIQNVDALFHEREKLEEFRKLGRSLAHDLNNPASAAARASSQLRESLQLLLALSWKLKQSPTVTDEHGESLPAMQSRLLSASASTRPLDPISQSDLEDQLTEWLDDHDIEDSWKLAPALVKAGITTEGLDQVVDEVGGDVLGDALLWMVTTLEASSLLDTVEHGTTRISYLVNEFKSYVKMDQARLKEVDIHADLDSTVMILRSKLKEGVKVTKQYDPDLPRISAYGDELNRVWTNLIDNAIDAMEGKGQIWIHTSHDDGNIKVEITDNGPGIPPEVQPNVFKAFFTTKEKGGGTGLGLDISRRIIMDKHHGDISFTSRPGETTFRVRLPINQEAAQPPVAAQEPLEG